MAKIGRNDPCLCGSGKKYKRCCLGIDRAPHAGVLKAYDTLLRQLAGIEPFPWAVTLSAEARPYWQEIEQLVFALKQLPETSRQLRSWLSKVPANSARLMLVLHAIDGAAIGV